MRVFVAFAAALLLPFASACSSGFESDTLGVSWKPPKAFALESQEAGPPPSAKFSQGLELRRVDLKLPEPTETSVGPMLEQVRAPAAVPQGAQLVSSRVGSIPAGAVARYELKDRGERFLVYVLPRDEQAFLLSLRADEGRFSQLSNTLERSLTTLKVR